VYVSEIKTTTIILPEKLGMMMTKIILKTEVALLLFFAGVLLECITYCNMIGGQ
jgi:hypothetical protein